MSDRYNLFMKPIQLIIISIILLGFACGPNKKKLSRFEIVPKSDTTCLKDLDLAKKDIAKGHLVYCHYVGNIVWNGLRSEKEMTLLLNSYGISFKNETSSCIVYEGQSEHCYCEFMDEQIRNKFGSNFLDSLLKSADSLYVFQHLSDTFYYADCDTWPHYPNERRGNEEFSEFLQSDFNGIVKYPEGYTKKENRDTSAFVDIGFVVNKEGRASNLSYNFIFAHEENERYEPYFESVIEPLIIKIKWASAVILKQKVNSSMNLRIEFE